MCKRQQQIAHQGTTRSLIGIGLVLKKDVTAPNQRTHLIDQSIQAHAIPQKLVRAATTCKQNLLFSLMRLKVRYFVNYNSLNFLF